MTQKLLRLAVSGVTGRMGQALFSEISRKQNMALSHGYTQDENVFSSEFDVFIDFTRPEGTMKYIAFCHTNKKPIVIGTTGFTEEQKQKIQRLSQGIPIIMDANFSVGMHVLLKVLGDVTRTLGAESDIEIIETHHKRKVDAPSGTALAMGNVIAMHMGRELRDCAVYDRYAQKKARLEGSIGFTSIRAGEIVGEHTALFANEFERLELSHKASGRHTFALGALKAAEWIMHQPPGLYGMQNVLNLA